MKNRGKTSTKVALFIGCMVFGLATIAGGVMTAFCAYFGYYNGKSNHQIQNSFYERAYPTAELKALQAGEEYDFHIESFKNYEFAVLEGEVSKDADLKNSKNYIVSNFSNGFPEDYEVATYSVGEKTTFYIASSYWDYSYLTRGTVVKDYAADAICRDESSDKLYAKINGAYYQIEDYVEYSWDENAGEYDYIIDGQVFEDEEIENLRISDSQKKYPTIVEITVSSDKSEINVTMERPDPTEKTYTIISSTAKNLVTDSDDFLYEAKKIYDISQTVFILGPICLGAGGILCLIFFICLMCQSGYHNTEEYSAFEIYQAKEVREGLYLQRRGLDKIPMDLNLILIISLEGIVLAAATGVAEAANYDMFFVFLIAGIALVFLAGAFALLYCMTLASNFKCKSCWKNTLCYIVIKAFVHWWKKKGNDLRESAKSIKMQKRVLIGFCLVSFVELLILLTALDYNAYGFVAFLFLLEKALLLFVIWKLLIQFGQIKNVTKEIAKGNLEASVNTDKMFLDLQEEGCYINSIKNGLDLAIGERIKSERFQTELITNVSHDIKTPLTSIISYVDLLQKEKLDNEKAKEYLEVLSRQSQRLKKLLQDLLDASKASTGNVELHMEKVDAGVLLHQTVGEFEEKMKKAGIDLKIKMPSKSPSIMADSRYLWRVFDNLMNNICKYSQEQTRAYINLDVKDAKVFITFLNTSKDELNISADELMQRFVRGDSSRNTEGSGLGLSIASSLTELMDGEMQLSIDGDLFKVTLIFEAK